MIYAGAVARAARSIGIHQPYLEVPTQPIDVDGIKARYGLVVKDIKSYLAEMNVDGRLADEMLKISPTGVRYLNQRQQERYGLTFFDPVEREVRTIEEARKLGLDRREYNRRPSVAVKECNWGMPSFHTCYRSVLETGKVNLPDFSEFGTPVEQ
jgi:hypothetical protein